MKRSMRLCSLFTAAFYLFSLVPSFAVASGSADEPDGTTYFHMDVSGSPMMATDANGAVRWKENYTPYGEKRINASTSNGISFHGKPFDDDTGLSYMGARYYNPSIGRFMGVDPVHFKEDNIHSFNRYAYANNNPYKYVDPDGKSAFTAALVVVGVVAGITIYAGGVAPNASITAMDTTAHLPSFDMSKYLGGTPVLVGKRIQILPIANRDNQPYMSSRLPDDALVCRAGGCTPENFTNGNGVTTDAEGNLDGVSVTSAAGKSVKELSKGYPHKQVGVTTVGDVRKAGGDVVPSKGKSKDHATLSGITADKASELLKPTQRNPNFIEKR